MEAQGLALQVHRVRWMSFWGYGDQFGQVLFWSGLREKCRKKVKKREQAGTILLQENATL